MDHSINCSKHKKQFKKNFFDIADKKRPSATNRGYDSKWSIYAKAFIIKHPICCRCGNKSTLVGHIKPAFAFPNLFWDKSNHVPLCRSCNSLQDKEDRKLYKKVENE